ncbi:MAG: class I SAM-dependent methyltransferase [Myxococcales bacterium]|nr:class I SAM-dependent methyltransferase [Myxococcales bacterium]
MTDDDADAPGDDAHRDPWDLDAGTVEHYENAVLYDHEYRRRRADVNHYRRVATDRRSDGPVLELGCGSGRVLLPLAKDGHTVIGLDASRAMLRRARERQSALGRASRSRVHLVQGDMRTFAFRARFPLVLCPFNAFQHLYTRVDALACLERVREQLAPGGVFAFDVLLPDMQWLMKSDKRRWSRTRFRHPTTGGRVEYSTNHTYDAVTQISFIRIYYETLDVPAAEKRTDVVRLAQKQYFPVELETLLHVAGFRIAARHGGFEGEPFDGLSESQVLLCEAR